MARSPASMTRAVRCSMICCSGGREWLFFAFDLLHLNGEDLRVVPPIERKTRLNRLMRRKRSRVLYVDHVETGGRRLFQKVCEARRRSRCGKSPHQIPSSFSAFWRRAGVVGCFSLLRGFRFGLLVFGFMGFDLLDIGARNRLLYTTYMSSNSFQYRTMPGGVRRMHQDLSKARHKLCLILRIRHARAQF